MSESKFSSLYEDTPQRIIVHSTQYKLGLTLLHPIPKYSRILSFLGLELEHILGGKDTIQLTTMETSE